MEERVAPTRHWLSVGFEELAARKLRSDLSVEFDFDVVIVGSGYGASIAAYYLAKKCHAEGPLSIAILERGSEYLSGMFPTNAAELIPQVRFASAAVGKDDAARARGTLDGLFDFRPGAEISSLVANGLGGGSLINAGVMLEPRAAVFDEGWPVGLAYADIEPHLRRCQSLLGARPFDRKPQKWQALDRLGGAQLVPITAAPAGGDPGARCVECGNCMTGCNFGAKGSLDTTLLARAMEANENLECFTGATVHRFSQHLVNGSHEGWQVEVGFTSAGLKKRFPDPVVLKSRYLVIAAGTFGSTELLMRSRSDSLRFSSMLGKRVSGNGDMLAFGYSQDRPVRAISRSVGDHRGSSGVGPTITGSIDCRDTCGILIEELAVPNAMKEAFEQVLATSAALRALTGMSHGKHRDGFGFPDPFSIDVAAMDATSIYALMGDDGAAGELVRPAGAQGEGNLAISWPGYGSQALFTQQIDLLKQLTAASDIGGEVVANPLWQPLPDGMDYLGGGLHGALITVHPLGGCAMGNSGEDGVVDHLGQVFVGDSDACYPNLCILDGAIIPKSLGVNPALTISAIARRAIRQLGVIWGIKSHLQAQQALSQRPVFRMVSDAMSPAPTRVQVHERMVGDVVLDLPTGPRAVTLELTLQTKSAPVDRLHDRQHRVLAISPLSRLRVFPVNRYELIVNSGDESRIEARLARRAIATMQVSGELRLFPRGRSGPVSRSARAWSAWLLNRGFRDIYQAYKARDPAKPLGERFASAMSRSLGSVRLASHSGEIRYLDYHLEISRFASAKGVIPSMEGALLRGKKVISYSRASNPLRQMMELRLERFPGLRRSPAPVLRLDPRYLARIGVPLIRVTEKANTPSMLLDLLGLGGYLLRMLLGLHAWTFRLPDAPTRPPLRRLPGPLPGVSRFEQYSLPDPSQPGRQLPVLVTRYARPGAKPVMLLHGYSASGTTFAHESLSPSFAAYMFSQGWDVWVIDLRTSAGLPSAVEPWTFEEVADIDIPAAVDHIYRTCGNHRINVVAHCMGAAMFSMSVLAEDDRRFPLRASIRHRVARVVLTQVGPGVVFSPANIFRAYVADYLKDFLSLTRFDFRVDSSASAFNQLIDRALNILPYPEHEFRLENPTWPPWKRTEFVGIRHRMDLLYGRDFSLANVQPGFLETIDAQFGPLNLDTVSQVVQFARWKNVTDKQGRNRYYLRSRLKRHWQFETLGLHGADNGLSSVATLFRNKRMFRDAGIPFKAKSLPGFGHQDIWVSPRSETEVFPLVHEFLSQPPKRVRPRRRGPLFAAPPFLGPVVSLDPERDDVLLLKLGSSPNLSAPSYVAVVPVQRRGAGVIATTIDLDAPDLDAGFTLIRRPAMDDNGMTELSIPRPEPGVEVLVLMLYNEHPSLFESAFGGDRFTLPSRRLAYRDNETIVRVHDALREALGVHGESLEAAIVPPFPRRRAGADCCIAFGSCQYAPMVVDRQLAFKSYERLAHRIADTENPDLVPDLLLLVGDQVYVDPTAGYFDPGGSFERYARPHIDLLSNDWVQAVVSKVPTCMMLDDHELVNDWESNPEDRENLLHKERGIAAFRSFQFNSLANRDPNGFWGEVSRQPLPVYMLNTRTERNPRSLADAAAATMISEAQFNDFRRWLRSAPVHLPKIVSCASLPLPRHHPVGVQHNATIRSDAVDGYPSTLEALLSCIAEHRIQHVVFVSGDEHRAVTAQADLFEGDQAVARITSIHTTPLYAPFPFANAVVEDFVSTDRFTFCEGRFRCEVHAQVYAPGDGFTILNFRKERTRWHLDGEFEGIGQGFNFEFGEVSG